MPKLVWLKPKLMSLKPKLVSLMPKLAKTALGPGVYIAPRASAPREIQPGESMPSWNATLPIRNATLDTFLPLSRMQQTIASARASYASANPYPHVVLDDFFAPEILDLVLEEFPRPGEIPWQRFDNDREIKLAAAAESSFGPVTRLLLYHLNSITFLNFLSEITGIRNLIPDPSFEGGGLHQIQRGGKLGIHADFNKHREYRLDRRLNLLLYLNKDWREEYGGHLELWDRRMTHCEAKVLPIFNRVMIFGTTDYTYHGHPDPLGCPVGMTRKSLALYYFSNGRPAEEISSEHTTMFQARREGEFRLTFGQRLRALGKDILPPIIARQLRRTE
jgi:2OG-Fe(II) oxygenase superfamily